MKTDFCSCLLFSIHSLLMTGVSPDISTMKNKMLNLAYPSPIYIIIQQVLYTSLAVAVFFVGIKNWDNRYVIASIVLIAICIFIILLLRLDILYRINNSIKVDPEFEFITVSGKKYLISEIAEIKNNFALYEPYYRIRFKDSTMKNIYFINTSVYIPLIYYLESKCITKVREKVNK
jgi:hypothetical protein